MTPTCLKGALLHGDGISNPSCDQLWGGPSQS